MNHGTGFQSRSLTTILCLCILALGAAGLATQVAAQTTEYRVTFTAAWSAETHPEDFPGFPHFSPLIGGTHDEGVTFWEVGGLEVSSRWRSRLEVAKPTGSWSSPAHPFAARVWLRLVISTRATPSLASQSRSSSLGSTGSMQRLPASWRTSVPLKS